VGAVSLSVGGDDPLSPVRRIPPDDDVPPAPAAGLLAFPYPDAAV
jgi:hypothetical protein